MTALSYATLANVKTRLGTTDTNDDTTLGTAVAQVNDWLEGEIGRQVGPIASATYIFDGYEAYDNQKRLYVRQGIRAITAFTVSSSTTAGDNTAVNSSDYDLLPRAQNRRPGWPAFEIAFHDYIVGSVPQFWQGNGNISITMTAGWDAIPVELTMVAEVTAVRAWRGRATGETDTVGTDQFGQMLVSKYVAPEHWRIINRYKAERFHPA